MKTILLFLFLTVSLKSKAQNTDVIYIFEEKSLVATYNNNFNGFGFYFGGYLTTTFPTPYIYTTPMSRINRVGLSFTNHKFSIMTGVFGESYLNEIKFQPDIWFKLYPLRIITKTKSGPDFVFAVNYMKGFRAAVGLSIPFGGIYYR